MSKIQSQQSQRLTVIAGPSGVGKGTIVKKLVHDYPHIYVSVSVTTRSPREGEQDGVHYYFISEDDFDALIDHDELLEWALVHGTHRYGTPRRKVEEHLAQSHPVLLEIDVKGAFQVKEKLPEAFMIFVAPPSESELRLRLQGRGSETEEQVERRMHTALDEMKLQDRFDAVVINDEVQRAAHEVATLIGLA